MPNILAQLPRAPSPRENAELVAWLQAAAEYGNARGYGVGVRQIQDNIDALRAAQRPEVQ